MHLSPSELADRALTTLIIIGQIAIARRLFRAPLDPRRRRVLLMVLIPLWLAAVIAGVMSFTGSEYTAPLPPALRTAIPGLTFFWGVTSPFGYAIYRLSELVAGRKAPAHSPERRSLIRTAGMAAAAVPFAVIGFGAVIERTNFTVTEVDLPIPDLHPDLVGKRIAQLSDLHVSPYLSIRDLARVVDMTNEQKPDLTVVTGDLITQPGDPLDAAIAGLARLRADAGVFGCLGNHERYCGCETYAARQLDRNGIRFLRHEARQLRWGAGALNLAGVDYQSPRQEAAYLAGAEKLVVPGTANLLLSHNPDVFPKAVRQGYDAMLSGHTHGGQVTVEVLDQTLNFARFATRYVSGLYRIDGRSCYVTRGIGTIALPVRLGAPPEITIARLVRAEMPRA